MRARSLSPRGWRADDPAFGDGYRRLSVRVIEQALRDVLAYSGSTSDRQSARAFLAGSPMLDLWCQLAALDPARVVAHAGHLFGLRPTLGRSSRAGRHAAARQIKSTP